MAINLEALRQLSQHPNAFELFCKQYLVLNSFQRPGYIVSFEVKNSAMWLYREVSESIISPLDICFQIKTTLRNNLFGQIVVSEYSIGSEFGVLNLGEEDAIRKVAKSWEKLKKQFPRGSLHNNSVEVSLAFMRD